MHYPMLATDQGGIHFWVGAMFDIGQDPYPELNNNLLMAICQIDLPRGTTNVFSLERIVFTL